MRVKIFSIKCSQCNLQFKRGADYREHWEKNHFYPYFKNGKFEHEKALAESKSLEIYSNGI